MWTAYDKVLGSSLSSKLLWRPNPCAQALKSRLKVLEVPVSWWLEATQEGSLNADIGDKEKESVLEFLSTVSFAQQLGHYQVRGETGHRRAMLRQRHASVHVSALQGRKPKAGRSDPPTWVKSHPEENSILTPCLGIRCAIIPLEIKSERTLLLVSVTVNHVWWCCLYLLSKSESPGLWV